MTRLFCTRVPSPLGDLLLVSDGEALCGLYFEGQRHFPGTLEAEERAELAVFDSARAWLQSYFAGQEPTASVPLRLDGTAFQRAVWERLLEIPYGETVSYGTLARELAERRGRPCSARAVGGAAGRNPVSLIVPCHRVVGADGSLTGYAGGAERKRKLLEIERSAR
jgi:methylated-DNA-[protein]-cysteine S-methyltransferase